MTDGRPKECAELVMEILGRSWERSARVESVPGDEVRLEVVVDVHLPENVVPPWPMRVVVAVRDGVMNDSPLELVGGERLHDRRVRRVFAAALPELAVAAAGSQSRRGAAPPG